MENGITRLRLEVPCGMFRVVHLILHNLLRVRLRLRNGQIQVAGISGLFIIMTFSVGHALETHAPLYTAEVSKCFNRWQWNRFSGRELGGIDSVKRVSKLLYILKRGGDMVAPPKNKKKGLTVWSLAINRPPLRGVWRLPYA